MFTPLNPLSRREFSQKLSGAMASLVLFLGGCGGGSGGGSSVTTSDTDVSESPSSDDGSVSDGDDSADDAVNSTNWLSGGTNAMEAPFPPESDPFDSGLGNLCSITDQFTIGPCYFDVDDDREDISEGQPGLPMTLAMKIVDANCEAIENAVVEVWWCNSQGIYSADDSDAVGNVSNFNAGFCSGDDAQARNARWFRGIRSTDASGNVYFKACFPGWYTGRATHIHFRIVLNGSQQLISQFGFDDEFSNDIFVNHPDYTGRENTTTNYSDNVFNANTVDQYLFELERQYDGSLLAYKAVQLSIYN